MVSLARRFGPQSGQPSAPVHKSRRSPCLAAALCAALSLAVAYAANADGTAPFASGPPLRVENNFGFPMGFDISKMDTSANPRQDFTRYAAGKKLTAEQKRDFRATYKTRPYVEVKAMLGNLDLDTLFQSLGLPTGVDLLVSEVDALKERNALLAEYSLEDTKAYVQWEALRLTFELRDGQAYVLDYEDYH